MFLDGLVNLVLSLVKRYDFDWVVRNFNILVVTVNRLVKILEKDKEYRVIRFLVC